MVQSRKLLFSAAAGMGFAVETTIFGFLGCLLDDERVYAAMALIEMASNLSLVVLAPRILKAEDQSLIVWCGLWCGWMTSVLTVRMRRYHPGSCVGWAVSALALMIWTTNTRIFYADKKEDKKERTEPSEEENELSKPLVV